MRRLRLLLRLVGLTLAATVYVWFAAVRNAASVKRRKAARRARRQSSAPGPVREMNQGA